MSVYVDIRKKAGSFTLDVKLEAGRETLSLLGNSGCGKSMTLRCIAGIERPDEGIIRINDRTVFDSEKHIDCRPQKRGVGYLFQNYALFPNMTLLQNVMVGAERSGTLTRAQRWEVALRQLAGLKLDGLEDSFPSQLSGGQQQRAALARILVSQPEILLLDEPFSALDAALRWETEQLVRAAIADFPGTAILVTHDRDEVYRLCDRLAVYRHGCIDTLGEKWELFADPRTANTARLTGCKNLSRARCEGDRIVAEDWGLSFPLLREGPWTWVGIRAHRFLPGRTEDGFSFPYRITNDIEDTFSRILQIQNADSPDSALIRWETDKETAAALPETGWVHFPGKELLLLTD